MTIRTSWAAVEIATVRFFVNLRIASRAMAGAIAFAGGRLSLVQALTAVLLFGLYDLLLAYVLGRRRMPLAVRLPLDCADVALWCVLVGGSADAPSLLASPLAFETALRDGRRALLVVALVGASATAALTWVGEGPAIAPFLWPAAGLLGGMVIRRYVARQVRQRLRVADAEREAAASRARLAGQSSVAFGRDTVVDAATGVWPLLAGTGPVPRSPLAAWRRELADSVGDHAEFLGTALLNWQTLHNATSPDLAKDVDLHIAGEDATLLLARGQVRLLGQVLAEMRLRGRVPVTVRRRAPWSQEQRLTIGNRLVRLPAAADPMTGPYDVGPLIIALGALGSLGHALPSFEALPLPVTLALAAFGLLTARWAYVTVTEDGAAAHGRVVCGALVFGAADAVVSTLLMTNLTTGGLTRTPFLHCMLFLGPLAVFYWPDLRRWSRWAAGAAMAAIVTTGLALMPAPLHPHDLATLVWPAAFLIGATEVRAMLDQDNSELARTLAARHRFAIEHSHAQGCSDVFRLVDQDLTEAETRLRDHADAIDPVIAAHAAERLTRIRARLGRVSTPDDDR
ncbi:hypothetical protein AB0L06_18695 [Spirillospora sp. NPDC052269]